MKQGGCLGNLTAPECGLYLRLGGAMMACEVFLSQVMMMGGGALMWTAWWSELSVKVKLTCGGTLYT